MPRVRMRTPSSPAQWGLSEKEKKTLKGCPSPQNMPRLEKAEGKGGLGKRRTALTRTVPLQMGRLSKAQRKGSQLSNGKLSPALGSFTCGSFYLKCSLPKSSNGLLLLLKCQLLREPLLS